MHCWNFAQKVPLKSLFLGQKTAVCLTGLLLISVDHCLRSDLLMCTLQPIWVYKLLWPIVRCKYCVWQVQCSMGLSDRSLLTRHKTHPTGLWGMTKVLWSKVKISPNYSRWYGDTPLSHHQITGLGSIKTNQFCPLIYPDKQALTEQLNYPRFWQLQPTLNLVKLHTPIVNWNHIPVESQL